MIPSSSDDGRRYVDFERRGNGVALRFFPRIMKGVAAEFRREGLGTLRIRAEGSRAAESVPDETCDFGRVHPKS